MKKLKLLLAKTCLILLPALFILACAEEVLDVEETTEILPITLSLGNDLVFTSGEIATIRPRMRLAESSLSSSSNDPSGLDAHLSNMEAIWRLYGVGGELIELVSSQSNFLPNVEFPDKVNLSFTVPPIVESSLYRLEVRIYYKGNEINRDSMLVTLIPSEESVAPNEPPSVAAGSDVTVFESGKVNLTATVSDPDVGKIPNKLELVNFSWFSTEGDLAIFAADTLEAYFYAPSLPTGVAEKRYTLTFEVLDSAGHRVADSLVVTVKRQSSDGTSQPQQDILVVDAGPNFSVDEDQNATATATARLGAADAPGATFTWSIEPKIDNFPTSGKTISFTAPKVSANTEYAVSLIATDSKGNTGQDHFNFTVRNVPEVVANPANTAPVARITAPSSATSGEVVEMNGSASSDREGAITYLWTTASTVRIYSPESALAGFVAPRVSQSTVFEFVLTVLDEGGLSHSTSISITVNPPASSGSTANLPPTVSLSALPEKSTYQLGEKITLAADAEDRDGQIAGVTFDLNGQSLQVTNRPFTTIWEPSAAGSFAVKARAEDDDNAETTSETITLTVVQPSGSGQSKVDLSTDLNSGDWHRVVIGMTNDTTVDIDMANSRLVFEVSSDYDQFSFGPTEPHQVSRIQPGNYVVRTKPSSQTGYTRFSYEFSYEHWTESYVDTVLKPSESFRVQLREFRPHIPDAAANELIQSLKFYLADELVIAYGTLNIDVPAKPAGVTKDTIKVFIRDLTEGKNYDQEISWGRRHTNILIEEGNMVELYFEDLFVESAGKIERYRGIQNPENKLTFVSDPANTRNITLTQTKSELQFSDFTVNFQGVPAAAKLTLKFTDQNRENGETVLRGVSVAAGPAVVNLPHGKYVITADNFKTPEGFIYATDASPAIDFSGDASHTLNFKKHEFGPIPGLPNFLSMGTVTSGAAALNDTLKTAKVNAIFKYAGAGGNGDRGLIVEPVYTARTIAQARTMEDRDANGNLTRSVLPVMVVYTAEASGGGCAEADIVLKENLVKHNINLIKLVREIQKNKDSDHPIPGGIILNADFLGAIQQNCGLNHDGSGDGVFRGGIYYGSIVLEDGSLMEADPNGRPVPNNSAMQEAMEYAMEHDDGPEIILPRFDDDFFGFLQTQNYIIRAYGPDVVFGWQENLWSVSSSHWIHGRYDSSTDIAEVSANSVNDFLDVVKVYEGIWSPDFITFDKYERDGFGSIGRRDYAFNHNDWDNYLEYAKLIGDHLDKPIVLWQIEGGHMPFKGDDHGPFDILEHPATAPQYFFGEPRLEPTHTNPDPISGLEKAFLELELGGGSKATIDQLYGGESMAEGYLRENSFETKQPYDWPGRLQRAVNYGVANILWGGGATTSVVPLDANTGDDNGWLKNKVNGYYSDGGIPLPPRSALGENTRNTPPKVNAGSNTVVEKGDEVRLNGTAEDPDPTGYVLSKTWTSNYPGLTITRPHSFRGASFIAPNVKKNTQITLTLTATDNRGGVATDQMTVTVVGQATEKTPPVVNAGSNAAGESGETLNLAATASDADGEISSKSWKAYLSSNFNPQNAATNISFSSADSLAPSVALPNVNAVTSYYLVFTATDDDGLSSSDSLLLTVRPKSTAANQAPSANAGPDLSVASGSLVELKGSASDDDDGLTYGWRVVTSNSGIALADANQPTTRFTAPQAGSSPRIYEFELVVTDKGGLTDSDRVLVTVSVGKQIQSTISSSQTPGSISGEVGENWSATLSGGSGAGTFQVQNSNPNAVGASISGNTLTLNFLSAGTATLSAFKAGDEDYLQSNTLAYNLTVTEPETKTAVERSLDFALNLDFSVTPFKLQLVNNTEESMRIGNMVFEGKFPFSMERESLLNGITSASMSLPSKWVRGAETFDASSNLYTTRYTLSWGNESWRDVTLGPQESLDFSFRYHWEDAQSATILNFIKNSDNYSIVSVNITEPASTGGDGSGGSTGGGGSGGSTGGDGSGGSDGGDDSGGSDGGDGSGGGNSAATEIPPYPRMDDPVKLAVKDWGQCLQMGAYTDRDATRNPAFTNSGVRAIFSLAGNGSGNRGALVEGPSDSVNNTLATINQAGNISSNVLPVMAVATADPSSDLGAQDLSGDNLQKHYVNLIRTVRRLQEHGKGSIVLNPGLIESWQKSVENPQDAAFVNAFGAKGNRASLPVRAQLQNAVNWENNNDSPSTNYSNEPASPPGNIPAAITDNVEGYVQSLHFLIRHYGPSLTFGWAVGISGTGSPDWAHKHDYAGRQELWNSVSYPTVRFLNDINLASGAYKPDFIAFEQSKQDGLGSGKAHYAFNSGAWENYLNFVKHVSDSFELPAMLWQIPGGHMPATGSGLSATWIAKHAGTAGPYFLGDGAIEGNLSKISATVRQIALNRQIYGVNSVSHLLGQFPNFNWGDNRLRKAAYHNVFAIMWGSPNATGVAPDASNSGNDGGWLQLRIKDYYNKGCMLINTVGTSQQSHASISQNPTLNDILSQAALETEINDRVFLYQTPDFKWVPSTVYRWKDFVSAVTVLHNTGVNGQHLWLGGYNPSTDTSQTAKTLKSKYALVNLAAFLSQSMKETIKYNACDENNWDSHGGKYFFTAACGQLGELYSSYGGNDPFRCPLDPKMEISAKTNSKWSGAPPPLFAAPDNVIEAAGMSNKYWSNYGPPGDCVLWGEPGKPTRTEVPGFELSDHPPFLRDSCEIYLGQKAGGWVENNAPLENNSVEGCGWWGRGVIQTSGPQNFGLLNHYMGRSHLRDNNLIHTNADYALPSDVAFPHIDFCSNPGFVCSSTENPELKWMAGLFFWIQSVERYEDTNTADGIDYDYINELKNYVDNGYYTQDNGNFRDFIDRVSSIVNRGCHLPGQCGNPTDGAGDRAENFKKVLKAFGLRN